MSYANGETMKAGDCISDNRGRVGTVTGVHDYGIFTVKWDDGGVGINYTAADGFTLVSDTEVSKASDSKWIQAPRRLPAQSVDTLQKQCYPPSRRHTILLKVTFSSLLAWLPSLPFWPESWTLEP